MPDSSRTEERNGARRAGSPDLRLRICPAAPSGPVGEAESARRAWEEFLLLLLRRGTGAAE